MPLMLLRLEAATQSPWQPGVVSAEAHREIPREAVATRVGETPLEASLRPHTSLGIACALGGSWPAVARSHLLTRATSNGKREPCVDGRKLACYVEATETARTTCPKITTV